MTGTDRNIRAETLLKSTLSTTNPIPTGLEFHVLLHVEFYARNVSISKDVFRIGSKCKINYTRRENSR